MPQENNLPIAPDETRLARRKALDELTALSQALGLYEEQKGTIEVSEILHFWLRQKAERQGMTPSAFAEQILTAYREGRLQGPIADVGSDV